MMFSIVVPVFGTEGLLPRCLDGFAVQTDGDFEVIVVDDASPGAKCEVRSAKEIVAQRDGRFRYVRHERNRSLFQARLTGLRMAQGEYVIPFDSDDYALPGLLAALRDEIDSTVGLHLRPRPSPPDVIVYQMMYDRRGKIVTPSVRYKDERLSGTEALDRFFASQIQCGICGKAVRREVYLKAMDELAMPGDFYLNSSEDLCQTFPVLVNARTVSTLAYPGYRYWHNGDSLTATLTDPAKLGKAAENTRLVFDTLADFVRRNGHDAGLLLRLERFLRPTLRWYLGALRDLPDAEWRVCAAELCSRFDPALVAREAMLLVSESNSYRVGKALVRPFKWLKR